MSKKRNATKKLQEEDHDIFLFLMDCLEPDANGALPIAKVHNHYINWRKYNGLKKTILSIKGFGRMLPASLARKYVYYSDSPSSRSVLGVRLKDALELSKSIDA